MLGGLKTFVADALSDSTILLLESADGTALRFPFGVSNIALMRGAYLALTPTLKRTLGSNLLLGVIAKADSDILTLRLSEPSRPWDISDDTDLLSSDGPTGYALALKLHCRF